MVGITSNLPFYSYAQDQETYEKQTIFLNDEEEKIEATTKSTSPLETYGKVGIGLGYAVNFKHPKDTDFYSSLIQPFKTHNADDVADILAKSLAFKLGFKKQMQWEDNNHTMVMELGMNKEKNIVLKKAYINFNTFYFGLKENNFCKVSNLLPVTTLQVGAESELNENFTVGFSIEENKVFNFYPEEKKDIIKQHHLKPRKDIPAASMKSSYKLNEDMGVIEISVLLRPLLVFDSKQGGHITNLGFGGNIGSDINIGSTKDKVIFNVVGGQGIGEYIENLNALSAKEVTSIYILKDDKIKAINMFGAYLSLQHIFNDLFNAKLQGGYTILNPLGADNRKDGSYHYGIQFGPQFTLGKTRYHCRLYLGFAGKH